MAENKSPDRPSASSLKRSSANTANHRISSAPSSAPSDKEDRSVPAAPPWAGSERQWKVETTTGQMKRPKNISEAFRTSAPPTPSTHPTPLEIPKPHTAPKTVKVRPDSYPPDDTLHAMNRSSLPAMAAQSEVDKRMSSETKLGIAATVLATVIIIALLTWYFLDVLSENAQTKEMQTVQKMMIERLEHRLQALNQESADDESQAIRQKVRVLAAQLLQAKKGVEEAEDTASEEEPEDDGDYESLKPLRMNRIASTENTGSSNRQPAGETAQDPAPESAPPDRETEESSTIPTSPYDLGSPPTRTNPSREEDQLDSLLGTSSSSTRTDPKPSSRPNVAAEPASTLPVIPSRQQVQRAMSAVGPSVKQCGDGRGGKIKMELTISGKTGRVINAQPITQEHAGTTVGICVTRVVQLAKFPKFQKNTLVIKYPFEL